MDSFGDAIATSFSGELMVDGIVRAGMLRLSDEVEGNCCDEDRPFHKTSYIARRQERLKVIA